MLYYVAHCYQADLKNLERAKQITRSLQIKDLENTYLCPLLTLSHLKYGEIGIDAEMELCYDLLSACDVLIVASEITLGVQLEINFAKMVGMEVLYLDEYGNLRP
jgi:hypothetical protein